MAALAHPALAAFVHPCTSEAEVQVMQEQLPASVGMTIPAVISTGARQRAVEKSDEVVSTEARQRAAEKSDEVVSTEVHQHRMEKSCGSNIKISPLRTATQYVGRDELCLKSSELS